MNWTWKIRARDGGMNGLEFACCTTAGDFRRVFVHAMPASASIEVVADDGRVISRGDLERTGEYSPITELIVDGDAPRRSEVWPDAGDLGVPVLLCGGEVGILRDWENADDHSWWRWTVEFSNHKGRPADWAPEGQQIQR
jgi:hypothetical protein